jgi:hypothetical protein
VSVAFSPDGKTLASGSADETIRLWDVSNPKSTQLLGKPLTGHTDYVVSVAFSPDGKALAAGSWDTKIILWNTALNSWKANACQVASRNLTYAEWQQYLPGQPYHFTCPDLPVSDYSIEEFANLAKDALAAQDTTTAQMAYQKALRQLEDTQGASLHNQVCWYGSIDGFAEMVFPACEKAVALATQNKDEALEQYRDTRALVRALTGNYAGAIEDYQAFVDWTIEAGYWYYDTYGKKREAWITALKAGKNPFDQETLQALRNE